MKPMIPLWTAGPEDDILYRWRLQRRLELARQGLPSSRTTRTGKVCNWVHEDILANKNIFSKFLLLKAEQTAFVRIIGAGRSSEVERSLMVRWVVGSIIHGVDPLSYFSFQPVLHDWCNKGCGMCYPVCGMVHIKDPLLLIDKSSLCGGSGFPFSLSEWSLTICLMPYNRK